MMSNLEYWDDIEGLGAFELEMELVVSTEPVLFVCKNNGERYLFMTYNSYDGIYVFCKTTTDDLIRMLTDEITMEKIFRQADYIYQTSVDDSGMIQYEKFQAMQFSAHRLPKVGAYYKIHSAYIQNYIKELRQENNYYVKYDCVMQVDTLHMKYDIIIENRYFIEKQDRYSSDLELFNNLTKDFLSNKVEYVVQELEEESVYMNLSVETINEICNDWAA